MAKYRKKPAVVEAMQFTGTKENLSLLLDFIDRDISVLREGVP